MQYTNIISPRFYPGYRASDNQERQYNIEQSYIGSNINKQIFYNITDHHIPWGGSYKYLVPNVFDDDQISKNSNAYKQKRTCRRIEHFGGFYNNYVLFLTIIAIICVIWWF